MGKLIVAGLIIVAVAAVFCAGLYFGRGEEGLTKLVEAIRSMKLGYVGGGLLLVLGGVPLFFRSALEKFAKKDTLAGAKLFYYPAIAFLFFCLVMQGGLDAMERLMPVFAPPPPALDDIEANLMASNGPARVDFMITAIVARKNTDALAGHLGTARIQVPHGTKTISKVFIAECPGYRATTKGPFEITDGKIEIPVVPTDDDPPPTVGEQLSTELLTEWPTDTQLAQPPKLEPKRAIFLYSKTAPEKLVLWVYDWSDHAKKLKDPLSPSWHALEFDDAGKQTAWFGFKKGTGWFSFFVRGEDGKVQYLGLRNLFNKPFTELIVKPATKPDQKCDAEFKEHD